MSDIENEDTLRRTRDSRAEGPERIRKKSDTGGLVERLLEIGRECAALPVLAKRRHDDMLYDKRGLPK